MFLLWRQNCTIRGFFWAKIASMPGGFFIKQRCCWFLPEKNEQDDGIDCDAQRLILRLPVPTEIFCQVGFFFNLLVPVSFKIWKIFVIWKMDFLLGWREFNTEGFVNLSKGYFFNFLGKKFLTLVKSLLSRKYWRGFCVIDLRVRRMLPEVSSYLSWIIH